MERKSYMQYITGLKGFACIFIMIGHYVGIYRYAEQFAERIPLLDVVLNTRLSFLLNPEYWLYLFFVVSGYLIARSNVKTIGEVAYKAINRLLRFAFPIFFAYLIIYVIYVLIGFHNAETSSLFQCNWYQGYYSGTYSVEDVLRSPIDVLMRGRCALNAPYWVLKDMFAASIMIYILKFCYHMCGEKYEAICFSALIVITFASSLSSTFIAACMMGMLVAVYEGREEICKTPYFAFWAMIVSMELYNMPKNLVSAIFFASLIIFIPKVKLIDGVFSSKAFQLLGKFSWGVYSFHWPLICSLGGILIIHLQSKVGLANSYIITCVLLSIITLILSAGFYFTFERLCAHLSKQMDVYLRPLMCSNKRE